MQVMKIEKQHLTERMELSNQKKKKVRTFGEKDN